jgi:hypothetical protein
MAFITSSADGPVPLFEIAARCRPRRRFLTAAGGWRERGAFCLVGGTAAQCRPSIASLPARAFPEAHTKLQRPASPGGLLPEIILQSIGST